LLYNFANRTLNATILFLRTLTLTQPPFPQADPNRPQRFMSHALVEIRRFRRLPFFIQSGILLDMSSAGFKIEFTSNDPKIKRGDCLWLHIPLSPLGIRGPGNLSCKIEVRWFDQSSARMGGVFIDLDQMAIMTIEQVIARLKSSDNQI